MEKLLEITDLHIQFKTERAIVSAVNGVNLTIHKSESLGLVGEAGAGKTTTAMAILNQLANNGKVLSGDIKFKGESVFKMSKGQLQKMRGDKISMIFQNPLTSLNPVFTVGEQIAMVLRHHKKMSAKEAREATKELLKSVSIPEYRLDDFPIQFSGGMRQRVGIAAGVACNPELIIADEPTTALDVTIQAQILELLKKMQREYNTSLLMITHNLGIISELCERVAVMYAGRIIEYGTSDEVFRNPMHPYTQGLLGALPTLDDQKERLTAIPGRVANPQKLPDGCRFHPRCQYCKEECKKTPPTMRMVTENHYVECYLVEESEK